MASRSSLPYVWGTTPAEVDRAYPSERFAEPGSVRAFRAVDVRADAETTYAWICQLRRAPYSYDLIDNRGRRSPRDLDPAMLDLQVGQRIATIFRVVHFVPGESVTMKVEERRPAMLFGHVVFTYAVASAPDGGTRLIGVIEMLPTGGPLARARRWLLLWGDLVMMRKQLNTLADLAAKDS